MSSHRRWGAWSKALCGESCFGKEEAGSNKESPGGYKQQRQEGDRFKTRTISREDINPAAPGLRNMVGGPGKGPSPRSIKQRRSEDGDRYKTYVIRQEDLQMVKQEEMSAREAALLEAEARLVVATITEKKATVRSRSASVDILSDHRSR